jgi:hypothetical protein
MAADFNKDNTVNHEDVLIAREREKRPYKNKGVTILYSGVFHRIHPRTLRHCLARITSARNSQMSTILSLGT